MLKKRHREEPGGRPGHPVKQYPYINLTYPSIFLDYERLVDSLFLFILEGHVALRFPPPDVLRA